MDVLVIGGNRFVGWLLGFRLLAAGHKVTLLNRGRLADPFGGRVDRIVADRTSRDLDRALQGRRFDAVVDLAAFTGDDGRRAAQLFAGCGHYVMVSTGQVYLVREGAPTPAREEDYDGPVMARPSDAADVWDWEYGIGKRACEDALPRRTRRAASPRRASDPDGERRARLPPPDGVVPVAARGRWPRPASRRRRAPRPARVRRRGRALPLRDPRPSRDVRKGLQRRAGGDADARRAPGDLRSHLGSCADVLPITTEEVRAAGLDPVHGSRRSAGAGCRSSIRPARAPSSAFATSRSGISTSERFVGQASSPTRPPYRIGPEGYARHDVERALARRRRPPA